MVGRRQAAAAAVGILFFAVALVVCAFPWSSEARVGVGVRIGGAVAAGNPVTVTAVSLGGSGTDGGFTASAAFAYATDEYNHALTATITGTNFASGCTSVNPTLNGVACTSPAFVNATTITCTVGSTTSPANIGTGNVVVTCPAGTGTGSNLFTYYDDPLTCLSGSTFIYWGEPRVSTVVTGNITALPDLSGAGNNPSTLTAVAYSASDSSWNNVPSLTCNGTTSTLVWASPTFATTQNILVWSASRMLSTTTAAWWSVSGSSWESRENGSLQWVNDGPTIGWGTNTGVLNTSTTWFQYGNSGGVANAIANVSIANASPVTATAGGTGFAFGPNTPFTMCSRASASIPMNVSFTSIVIAEVEPSGVGDAAAPPGQASCLQTYAQTPDGNLYLDGGIFDGGVPAGVAAGGTQAAVGWGPPNGAAGQLRTNFLKDAPRSGVPLRHWAASWIQGGF